MNTLLKIKHWQLFLILVVIPIIGIIIFTSYFLSIIIPEFNTIDSTFDPFQLVAEMSNEIALLSIGALIISFISYAWYWSVAITLQEKLPDRLKIDSSRFKLIFFIYIICTILVNIFGFYLFKNMFSGGFDVELYNNGNIDMFSSLINIVQLLLFGLYFYLAYFVAKVIKTCELKKETVIGDFAVEIFFIIFFFIGVWFLQPKINRIYNGEIEDEEVMLEENLVL